MRNFKNYDVWLQGIEIVKHVYTISQELPTDEKFGLKSQITRAAVSIPSNIAEGASRTSDTEFKRFLEIALGSLFELETQLIIINELGFIKLEKLSSLFNMIKKEGKMINSLITKIKATS